MDEQPARAEQISMETFVESATRAVLRALLTSGLNPQPLPPKDPPAQLDDDAKAAAPLNPQPLPPFDITVGLILSTGDDIAILRGSKI